MEFKIIETGTPEYEKMVDLRMRVLKEPFGIPFTESEREEDAEAILLGAFYLNEGDIVGCCFLSHINRQRVKLRQMAVETYYQRRGLGRELIVYAERIASLRGYQEVYLHARRTAIGFYEKQGYKAVSDIFTEVGIPHVEMVKQLTQSSV